MPDPEWDDLELVRQCVGGNPDARRAFVRRFAPYLARVIREAMKRQAAPLARQTSVEDILQNCFLELWKNDQQVLRRYDGSTALSTYLRVIALRQTYQTIQTQQRFAGLPAFETILERENPFPEPFRKLDREEQNERLEKALSRLSPRERMVLEWIRIEGMPYEDAARLLNLKRGTVAALLSRAQARLRDLLQENGV